MGRAPDELLSFIKTLRGERRLVGMDEAATKQGIILPLLTNLGWNTFNVYEVVPEYSVGGKRVDYALRLVDKNKVFIEVKKPSEDLDNHQEQLLSYSFQEGVKLAVLANGTTWWFYLPLREGSWEQRKFYTVDILEQEPEDVASKLLDFLSRAEVETGRAIETAENLYRGQQKANTLREMVPRAWDKIILETDETLMDLLSEATEKLCGYKPDAEIVEEFLAKNSSRFLLAGGQMTSGPVPPTRRKRMSVTGKTVKGFSLRGAKYKVDNWRDLLTTLCELLVDQHRHEFETVFSLRGRKRQYFSRNPNDLFVPRKLKNADIYVEVNHSAYRVAKLCSDVVSLLGYSESDLIIEAD